MLREGVADQSGFKNVRHYITAGEKLPQKIFDSWLEATNRPILEGVGATETCFLFLANRKSCLRLGLVVLKALRLSPHSS